MQRLFNFEVIGLDWANDIAAVTVGEEATVKNALFCIGAFSSFEQWDGVAIVGNQPTTIFDRPNTVELLSLVPKEEELGAALLVEVMDYMLRETPYRRLVLPPLPFRVLDIMHRKAWLLAGSATACSRKNRRNGRAHASCCRSRFCWQSPAVPG